MLWRELLQAAARDLAAAGIDNAAFEARLLAGIATDRSLEQLVRSRDDVVSADDRRRVASVIARRKNREPAAHIIGWREFRGLRFEVDSSVLTPRPDSETLIDAVLAFLPDRTRPWRLLDLGTGTGCLAIALLCELPAARAVAVDKSPAALAVARRNAGLLRVADRIDLRLGDWTRGIAERFDVVVSNPPYIRRADLAGLEPEVTSFEPVLALDGGVDGLAAYRNLAVELPTVLADAAVVVLEVGFDQADEVVQLFEEQGFSGMERFRDLAGIERVVTFRRPGSRAAPQ